MVAEFKPLSTWHSLVSSAGKSGEEKTACWKLQNHYPSYKSELTKVKVIFVCMLWVNRSKDSAPSFLKANSFACVSYQVSLNSLILVKDLLPLLIMEKYQSSGVLCMVLDEREEAVIDRERNVFDPILSVCSVSVSKERLWHYKL